MTVQGGVRDVASATRPERRGLLRLLIAIFGVQLMLNIATSGATNYFLPIKVDLLDPANKVANLGVVGTVAGLLAIAAQPIWGSLSDRTRSRWGRRVPWAVGGLAGIALSLVGLSVSETLLLVTIFAALVQIVIPMIGTPMVAVIADRAPIERRGLFSSVEGFGNFLGIMLGVIIASLFASSSAGLVVLAITAAAGIPFALLIRRDSRDLPRPARKGLRAELAALWVSPRRHPDFAWAFIARFVLMSGFWGINAFLLYNLQDYAGLGREGAAAVLPLISVVFVGTILIGIVPAGLVSDRYGRPKLVSIVATIITALSIIPPLLSPTLLGVTVGIAISGIGFGAYLSVNQALMIGVLPSTTANGAGMGILNISQAGGQAVAPAIAAVTIGIAGYPGLYVMVGVFAVISVLALLPIRSLR